MTSTISLTSNFIYSLEGMQMPVKWAASRGVINPVFTSGPSGSPGPGCVYGTACLNLIINHLTFM